LSLIASREKEVAARICKCKPPEFSASFVRCDVTNRSRHWVRPFRRPLWRIIGSCSARQFPIGKTALKERYLHSAQIADVGLTATVGCDQPERGWQLHP
jgi:hypothetical protein